MGFNAGIHPKYEKITAGKKIETAKLPSIVILPLSQHTGAPCEPIAKVGDYVKLPNGNPAEIVAVDAIGLNQAGHALYQWTLKDPVTGTVSKFKQTRNDAGMVNRVTTGDVKL